MQCIQSQKVLLKKCYLRTLLSNLPFRCLDRIEGLQIFIKQDMVIQIYALQRTVSFVTLSW